MTATYVSRNARDWRRSSPSQPPPTYPQPLSPTTGANTRAPLSPTTGDPYHRRQTYRVLIPLTTSSALTTLKSSRARRSVAMEPDTCGTNRRALSPLARYTTHAGKPYDHHRRETAQRLPARPRTARTESAATLVSARGCRMGGRRTVVRSPR